MNEKEQYDVLGVIRRLILAWLTAGTVMYLQLSKEQRKLDGITGLQAMSFFRLIFITVVLFFGLCLLSLLTDRRVAESRRREHIGIFTVFVILAIFALKSSFSVSFLIGILFVGTLLFVFMIDGFDIRIDRKKEPSYELERKRKNRAEEEKNKWETSNSYKLAGWAAGGFALLFFGFLSIWTVCRVLTYSAPTFDFGIFSQMFYFMKKTGNPYTTLERDGLLAHFCVHVSPIYYLLLPFYCLYPKPITLQVLQAAILTSAAVPVWKLARKHGLSPFLAALFELLLFLYPAYSGGASYDLHENIFLTPLLLWLFYAVDCKNSWRCIIFGILTCMVKEDAAVYTAVIGLWLLVSSLLKREKLGYWGTAAGMLLFFGSLVWFWSVTRYLTLYGDGVMTYRYQNFIYDGSSSLLTVIKAAFLLPIKVLYECMEQEKMPFLAFTLLPLCGMPFISRKWERLLLLIPYILIHLMSDYPYQHSIFFQYTYGSTACLFYLTIRNYADLTSWMRKLYLQYIPVISAVVIAGVCFGWVVVPKAFSYLKVYQNRYEDFQIIGDFLEHIPKEASAAATTFYTVPLANRDILYDVRYSSFEHLLLAEYIVLAVSDQGSYVNYDTGNGNGYENFTVLLKENGYQKTEELEGVFVIYQKREE